MRRCSKAINKECAVLQKRKRKEKVRQQRLGPGLTASISVWLLKAGINFKASVLHRFHEMLLVSPYAQLKVSFCRHLSSFSRISILCASFLKQLNNV